MRDLRVKDFDSFEFKPKQLVQDICQLYINLGDNEAFCRAVSSDGRSYSPTLFIMADRVLKKIVAPVELVTDMSKFAEKVKVSGLRSLGVGVLMGNSGAHEGFCRAVSSDGRSYSPTLFIMANRVLKKIVAPVELVTDMSKFAERIKVSGLWLLIVKSVILGRIL